MFLFQVHNTPHCIHLEICLFSVRVQLRVVLCRYIENGHCFYSTTTILAKDFLRFYIQIDPIDTSGSSDDFTFDDTLLVDVFEHEVSFKTLFLLFTNIF